MLQENRGAGWAGVIILLGLVLLGLYLLLQTQPVRVTMEPGSFPTPVPTHTPAPTHTPLPTPHPTPAPGDKVVRLAVSDGESLMVSDLSAIIHHINERQMTMPQCHSPVGQTDEGAYWWLLLPTDEQLRHFVVDGIDAVGSLTNNNPFLLDGDSYNAYRTNKLRCGDSVRSGFGGRVVTVGYARRS